MTIKDIIDRYIALETQGIYTLLILSLPDKVLQSVYQLVSKNNSKETKMGDQIDYLINEHHQQNMYRRVMEI